MQESIHTGRFLTHTDPYQEQMLPFSFYLPFPSASLDNGEAFDLELNLCVSIYSLDFKIRMQIAYRHMTVQEVT